ncbi:MAG TPA: glycosyltransferase, partial [Novosphingobium sp.]
ALDALAASHCLVQRTKPVPVAGIEAVLRGWPVSLAAFSSRRLHRYVRRTLDTRPIAAVFVFSGQMGHYVPRDFAGRLVVDLVDVDSAKFEAYAERTRGVRRWLFEREEQLLRAEEARLARRADATLLVSVAEAALLLSRVSLDDSVRVWPLINGIDSIAYDPSRVASEPELVGRPGPVLIFTGQMDYPPNIAAVLRAARRIMPLVRAQFPQAEFHVVGRRPTMEVRALDGVNGCRVHGAVPDVRPWLRGADLALVPLEIARGIQNKVLEAMAMELPVVASIGAATGINARPPGELAVGESDAELAGAVIGLLSDPARAKRIGQAARRCLVREHSWAAALQPLAGMLGARGADDA